MNMENLIEQEKWKSEEEKIIHQLAKVSSPSNPTQKNCKSKLEKSNPKSHHTSRQPPKYTFNSQSGESFDVLERVLKKKWISRRKTKFQLQKNENEIKKVIIFLFYRRRIENAEVSCFIGFPQDEKGNSFPMKYKTYFINWLYYL